MAEEPTTPAEKPKAEPEATPEKTFTQADIDRVVSDRLDRERKKYEGYDDLKAKAEKYDELSEKDKSESEKLAGKLTKAEQERDQAKSALLRHRIAAEKKLPAEFIDRLQGSSEEELAADADKLLELVKAPAQNPEFDGGTREPAPEPKSGDEAHNESVLALLGLKPNQ